MKIKILETKEVSGVFRVKVQTDWGIDDFGLSVDKNASDPITGEPLWLREVKKLTLEKYKDAVAPTGEDYVGKELEI